MSLLEKISCYWAIFLHILTYITAYHFDVNNVIIYEDANPSDESRGSYFGYSAALWNGYNSDSRKSWIIIGAPRANSSLYPGTTESGTVFKCEIGKTCEEWLMDTSRATSPGDGSWLGSSINVQNNDLPNVRVCSQRWVDISNVVGQVQSMIGTCYEVSSMNFSTSKPGRSLQPLHDTPLLYNGLYMYFLLSQAGFSMHVTTEDVVVLGCPGVLSWHGTPIRSETWTNGFIIPSPAYDESVHSSEYSGYAVSSGSYFDEDEPVYVTGAPRSENIRGKVVLFDYPESSNERITVYNKINGKQVGEYFGATLASCDIDGDGKDDLVVGAPHWTKHMDEGRIYIFRGVSDESSSTFEKFEHIDGDEEGGRFGSSITCLGDVDIDGYADIAVGAPYDKNGAIYIFHGSKNGLIRTQKIFGPKDTKGFGISISEARDIDNNKYADIAVGAYLSGHVTLLRSKRIVNMTVALHSPTTVQRNAESFRIMICSSYQGVYPPHKLNVRKVLKIDEMLRRGEIEVAGRRTNVYVFNETLNYDHSQSCTNFTIFIKKHELFLEPLKLSITQSLIDDDNSGILLVTKNNVTGQDLFCKDCAVLQKLHSEVKSHSDVEFKVMCGEDKVCNSNLTIELGIDLKNVDRYVIGSTHFAVLSIRVCNTGEEAYFPKAIIYMERVIRIRFLPKKCSNEEKNNQTIVICELDNPLMENNVSTVDISLDMSDVKSDTKEIVFRAKTSTQSKDASAGRYKDLVINCVAETDIGITGEAEKDRYSYTMIGVAEDQLPNISFQHIYKIKNYNSTPITAALLSISFPTHWIHAGKETEIVKTYATTGELDGRKFHCKDVEKDTEIDSSSYDATTMTQWLIGDNNSSTFLERKFAIIEGKVFGAFPVNRTLYINCTHPSVKWKTINCQLPQFKSANSVAKLVLTFDLLLKNFSPEIIQENDLIFFVTNGSTRLTAPAYSNETADNKPNLIMIGTIFIGSPLPHHVAAWVMPTSICFGLLLLILIILGLLKFGFFKRTKKLELQALKEQEDITPKYILETTSSREALDLT